MSIATGAQLHPAEPAQLPAPGEVFLDHLGFFVPSLEPAAMVLQRSGFRLTPFTAHSNRVDGQLIAAGTGNRCAMLHRGYIEILTAIGDTPLAGQLRERLSRHHGLHLAAFASADTAAEHSRLLAAGLPVLPLVDMRRAVAGTRGEEEAQFTIARVAPDTMAEGRTQFLTHHTPELVWREPDLDHPNGARALGAVWIAAVDPAEPAERFAQFTGRPPHRDGAVTTIALDRGSLHFATAEFLHRELAIAPGPPPPYLAACEIAVESLDHLRRALDRTGLDHEPVTRGIILRLPAAIGGAIVFRARVD
ncbi:MAG: VOC family protein [Stellaceae bacterium]